MKKKIRTFAPRSKPTEKFMQSPEMHAAYNPMRKRSTARSTNNFLFDGHTHTNANAGT